VAAGGDGAGGGKVAAGGGGGGGGKVAAGGGCGSNAGGEVWARAADATSPQRTPATTAIRAEDRPVLP
ncbi:MAG TPA: hypothetical protein VKO16_06440, partial [Polyangia bacterium]|nr:hypothetical protein [Polyangia bacterium]